MKNSLIGIRVTDKEKQKISTAAKRKGLTISEYIRALIIPKPGGKGA